MRRGVASSAGRFLTVDGVMLLRRGTEALGLGVIDDRKGTRTGVGVAGSLSSSSSSTTIDGALYPGVFRLKLGFMSVKRLQNFVVVILLQVRRNVFTSRSPLTWLAMEAVSVWMWLATAKPGCGGAAGSKVSWSVTISSLDAMRLAISGNLKSC